MDTFSVCWDLSINIYTKKIAALFALFCKIFFHVTTMWCRYAIMVRCWDKQPNERPDFSQLVLQLDRQLMCSLSDEASYQTLLLHWFFFFCKISINNGTNMINFTYIKIRDEKIIYNWTAWQLFRQLLRCF